MNRSTFCEIKYLNDIFLKGQVCDWGLSQNTGVHTHIKITHELYSSQPHAHAPPTKEIYMLDFFAPVFSFIYC